MIHGNVCTYNDVRGSGNFCGKPFCNYIKFIYICREEVNNHSVLWKSKFNFQCKITANANTGYLDPCMCRISVRRVGNT